MDMIAAAKATLLAAEEAYAREHYDHPQLPASFGYKHLHEMKVKMESEPMSKAKMGRWLGWMQAAVVANAALYGRSQYDLEYMKNLNRRYKKDA